MDDTKGLISITHEEIFKTHRPALVKRINFCNYSLSPADVISALPTEKHNLDELKKQKQDYK